MEQMQLEWTFADRLRKVRHEAGMNQADFAALIGVKPGTLANWEAGVAKPRQLAEVAMTVEDKFETPDLAAWLLGFRATLGDREISAGSTPFPKATGLTAAPLTGPSTVAQVLRQLPQLAEAV